MCKKLYTNFYNQTYIRVGWEFTKRETGFEKKKKEVKQRLKNTRTIGTINRENERV